mgnify:CR=1 FL=1
MKQTTRKLQDIIEDLIHDKEKDLDMRPMSVENQQFLVKRTALFVTENIHKYLDGAKRHGDNFIEDVDHLQELSNEVLDFWNYLGGAIYKLRVHDQRYQPKKEHKCTSPKK